MSYCKEEGKDRMIFAADEDLSKPSEAIVTELPEGAEDIANQGFVLPNGELNWECSCRGSMVASKCGVEFREFYSCVFKNKDEEEQFVQCMPKFDKLEECLKKHPDHYAMDLSNTDVFAEDEKEESKGGKVMLDTEDNKSNSNS